MTFNLNCSKPTTLYWLVLTSSNDALGHFVCVCVGGGVWGGGGGGLYMYMCMKGPEEEERGRGGEEVGGCGKPD